jgi:hypothetical protein
MICFMALIKIRYNGCMKYQIKWTFPVLLSLALIGIGVLLLSDHFLTTWNGWVAIQLHPSLLITDYLAVGGLVSTLLNVWIVTWTAILMMSYLKVPLTGSTLAGVLTILGFSFFGKNVWNFLPIWFGFYLYTVNQKTKLSSYAGTFLFSTGIAPLTSFIAFGMGLEWFVGLPLALVAGTLAGFMVPMVVSIVGKFHQGYNLYNTGFGIGFVSMVFAAVIRGFGVQYTFTNSEISYAFHDVLFWLVVGSSLTLIFLGWFLDRKPWIRLLFLLQSPGNLPSDYVKNHGLGPTLINTGLLGLLSIITISVIGVKISGPMIAAMYTLIGFGGYGKHPLNSIPVMYGLYLATFLPGFNLTDLGTSIGLFFVTALAPVAGKFGIIYGIIAGFIHLLVSPYALALQGGFDLYNNGFTAGFVAGIIVVFAQQLKIQLPRFKRQTTA